MPDPVRPRNELRRLLQHPAARPRVVRAVSSLLGVSVLALGALGALVIWHLVRRGQLIREQLGPPRVVPTLDIPDLPRPDAGRGGDAANPDRSRS